MYLAIVPELVTQSEGQIVRYCSLKAFMLLLHYTSVALYIITYACKQCYIH